MGLCGMRLFSQQYPNVSCICPDCFPKIICFRTLQNAARENPTECSKRELRKGFNRDNVNLCKKFVTTGYKGAKCLFSVLFINRWLLCCVLATILRVYKQDQARDNSCPHGVYNLGK